MLQINSGVDQILIFNESIIYRKQGGTKVHEEEFYKGEKRKMARKSSKWQLGAPTSLLAFIAVRTMVLL
jgi:hypothetical protein